MPTISVHLKQETLNQITHSCQGAYLTRSKYVSKNLEALLDVEENPFFILRDLIPEHKIKSIGEWLKANEVDGKGFLKRFFEEIFGTVESQPQITPEMLSLKRRFSILPLLDELETLRWKTSFKNIIKKENRKWIQAHHYFSDQGFAILGKDEYKPFFDKKTLMFFDRTTRPFTGNWILCVQEDNLPGLAKIITKNEIPYLKFFKNLDGEEKYFDDVDVLGTLIESRSINLINK